MMYKKGHFSLIELLVTFSILTVLLTLLQPSLTRLLSHNNTNLCKNNLRVIYSGIVLYSESHNNSLPGPSYTSQNPVSKNHKGHGSRNLSRFLSVYFEQYHDSKGNRYAKEFICPSNQELDLSKSLETRTQYRVNDKNRYFGYPETSYSGAQKDPKKFVDVNSPNDTWAMTDADRKNCGWIKSGEAPDLPLHIDISRNYLYFDGHLDNLVIQ